MALTSPFNEDRTAKIKPKFSYAEMARDYLNMEDSSTFIKKYNLHITWGDSLLEALLIKVSKLEAREALNDLCDRVHILNKKWWTNLETGERLNRNVPEMLMLCVSELAEAMEGHRKSLPDDKLPHRSMFEVELADCIIRIFDIAGGLGLDLGGALEEKLEYNKTRPDHQIENRKAEGGKKY